MTAADARTEPSRGHSWLLRSIVAAAAALMLFYVSLHGGREVGALAIGLLIAASAFDAINGTMPLVLLLGAVVASGIAAALDHRVPWLMVGAIPLGYIAVQSQEESLGWGDVLSVVVLAIALPFWPAIMAIIGGCAASLAATMLLRARTGRMTPYFALAGVIALWASMR